MKHFQFLDNKDMPVITTKKIIKKQKDILFVSHDKDDGVWQFLDGDYVKEEEAVIVSLEEIVKIDDTLNQVADLPLGWIAYRENKALEWNRDRY